MQAHPVFHVHNTIQRQTQSNSRSIAVSYIMLMTVRTHSDILNANSISKLSSLLSVQQATSIFCKHSLCYCLVTANTSARMTAINVEFIVQLLTFEPRSVSSTRSDLHVYNKYTGCDEKTKPVSITTFQ